MVNTVHIHCSGEDVANALTACVIDIFDDGAICQICEDVDEIVGHPGDVPLTSLLGGWTHDDLKNLQEEDTDICKMIDWKKTLTSKPIKGMLQEISAGVRAVVIETVWD